MKRTANLTDETLAEVANEGFIDTNPAADREESPSQFRPAPTHDEVRAYWASGRARDEAARMMEANRAKCAFGVCETEFYYIPQPGEESAPTDLVCEDHSK